MDSILLGLLMPPKRASRSLRQYITTHFGSFLNLYPINSIKYTGVDNSQGFWMFPSTKVIVNGTAISLPSNTSIADT